jgi:hypothetical protein
MLKQFDVIQIMTTKRIRYVSGPPGHSASPSGNWSVIGFIGSDVLAAKDSTVVRVPVSDIKKIANYDMHGIHRQIESAGYLKNQDINMPDHISQALGVDIAQARGLLLDHNYRITAKSLVERDLITEKVKEIWQRKQ